MAGNVTEGELFEEDFCKSDDFQCFEDEIREIFCPKVSLA